MIKVYEFTKDKTVGAFIDGIPEAVPFREGQRMRGELVKTCKITRVYVISTPSGDLYSLPIDSVQVDQLSTLLAEMEQNTRQRHQGTA